MHPATASASPATRIARAAGVRRRHAGDHAERHEQAVLGAEHELAHAGEPLDPRRLAKRVTLMCSRASSRALRNRVEDLSHDQ